MASLKSVSREDIRKARKAGYKRKKPKKPKSKTLNAMESFIVRYNDWVDYIKEGAKAYQKKEALVKELNKA